MEAHDVLADDVQIGRPVAPEFLAVGVGKADAGDVIGQRVDPHVHHVLVGSPGTGTPQSKVVREIDRSFSPPRTKLTTSLQPLLRQHESGTLVIELEQLVLIGREPEEIALLLDPFDRRALRPEALPCRSTAVSSSA